MSLCVWFKFVSKKTLEKNKKPLPASINTGDAFSIACRAEGNKDCTRKNLSWSNVVAPRISLRVPSVTLLFFFFDHIQTHTHNTPKTIQCFGFYFYLIIIIIIIYLKFHLPHSFLHMNHSCFNFFNDQAFHFFFWKSKKKIENTLLPYQYYYLGNDTKKSWWFDLVYKTDHACLMRECG